MADIIENEDVELDENGEVIDEAQEPTKVQGKERRHKDVGSEDVSLDSVKASDNAGPVAKKRKGDKSNSMPADKVKGDHPAKKGAAENYDYQQDLDKLIESEATLSEDFKNRSSVIFEAAINAAVSEKVDQLEEQYQEQLDEAIAEEVDQLVEKVDGYLGLVVDTWMEENKLAIQTGLRTEIAENFIVKMKEVFEESYIEVPEDKVDLVDDLSEQLDELSDMYNESVESALDLGEQLEEYKRKDVIASVSEGLADTEVEKLKTLAENVSFEDEETFEGKVETIKETYFGVKTPRNQDITEEVNEDVNTPPASNAKMNSYLTALRRSNK